MSRDADRQRVYDAEEFAFKGTPLADQISEADIQAHYATVLGHESWAWREVEIQSARVDMTEWGGKGGHGVVRTSAGRAHRYVVSHELAHVVCHALGDRGPSHGRVFRSEHVLLVGLIFGPEYADLLASAYDSFGLTYTRLARRYRPIIDIDALSIATAPTGGWKRSK